MSLDYYKGMNSRRVEGNYPSMIRIMFDYYNLTARLEGRTEPKLIETRENIIKEIDELISKLEPDELFRFAYCLRKVDIKDAKNDNPDDFFTKEFL